MVNENGFIAAIVANKDEDEQAEPFFFREDALIKIPGFTVAVKCFRNSEIVQDETGEVVVVIYGQLYDGVSATRLASRYKNSGIACFESLNGSFVILVIDKSQEKIILVTDRLSSLKLFRIQKGNTIFITSVLKYLVSKDAALDPVGIAWYFSNGYVQNNRTIFNGISCLERASTSTSWVRSC